MQKQYTHILLKYLQIYQNTSNLFKCCCIVAFLRRCLFCFFLLFCFGLFFVRFFYVLLLFCFVCFFLPFLLFVSALSGWGEGLARRLGLGPEQVGCRPELSLKSNLIQSNRLQLKRGLFCYFSIIFYKMYSI